MILLRSPKIILLLLLILVVSGSIALAQDGQLRTTGVLNNDTPFLEIPLTIEDPNSTIILDMRATSGDLDTLLYLVDINGNIIAENDDRTNGNTDSLLRFPQTAADNYTVIATRYGVTDGNTIGEFELTIDVTSSQIEVADYALTEDDLLAVGYPAIAPHEEAEWTILAYYGGDTNLEGGIINDFDEFEVAGGSDENVRVIMLVDRHPDFTDVNGDWDSVRLFEVGADVSGDHDTVFPPSLDSEPLADLGELDMGSGETLAQFLTWGIQNYPAKHYVVAFASHGAGWQGLITDDSSIGGTTILAIPELKQAFDAAIDIAGVEKFDLLINDACLMSSVEYHTSMSSYFEQSIASPEVVVNPALDMSLFTAGIRANPMVDLSDLGTQLVDTYMTRDTEGMNVQPHLTSALTDLNNFGAVTETTESFAAIINEDPARFVTMLGLARSNAYTYTAFLGNDTLIDVGHFMEQVIINSSDIRLINAAQAVLEALNVARIHGNSGEEVGRWSSYYNIYFPEKSSDFDRDYFDESPLQEWARMLQAYYNLASPRLWAVEDSLLIYHPPSAPKVTVTQVYPEVSSFAAPPTIRMEILGRNLSFGDFTVDQIQADGTAIRFLSKAILTEVLIGERVDLVNQWRSGVDQSLFSWLPMTLPVVTDGSVFANELLIKSGELAILEGRYRESGSETWYDVAVFFSIADGTVQRIISRSESGALAAIDIADGSEFQSYRQIVTADGRVVLEPGTLYNWGDLHWFDEVAPSGQYNLGFFVQAHGGISGFDSVTITVNNDGLDTNSQGYVDVNLGLNFRYPSDWIIPFDTGNQIVTGNLANTNNISVTYFNADLDNAWKISEDFQMLYGLTGDGFGTEVQFNEQMAVEFSYSYLQGDTIWYGQALAFYQEINLDNKGTGIVFSVEATSQEQASAQYSDLVTYLEVFDAPDLAAQDTGQWRYRFVQPGIAHPVPRDWDSVISTQAGEWTTFTSPSLAATHASFMYYYSANVDETVESLIADNLLENYELATYSSDNKTWQIIQYTAESEGESLIGRYYVTELNGQVYILWFETLNDENAVSTIRNLFEPMVDGFAPQNSVQYALGGLNPSILKAVMARAIFTCGEIDPDDACYGEGSLVVHTVQDADEDSENFGDPGDVVQMTGVEEMTVGILEGEDDTFDSFSIGVIELETSDEDIVDEPAADNVRIGVFGGITVVNETTEPVATDENSEESE